MKYLFFNFLHVVGSYIGGMILNSILAPALNITNFFEQFGLTVIFTLFFFIAGLFLRDQFS